MAEDVQIKTIPALQVLGIEGNGGRNELFHDLGYIFEYLYDNNSSAFIVGPGIGVFFSEFEPGKYLAAVPVREKVFPAVANIRLIRLPEMECACARHHGNSELIGKTLEDLRYYLVKNSLATGLPRREIYLGLEAGATAGPLTEIQIPLKLEKAYAD